MGDDSVGWNGLHIINKARLYVDLLCVPALLVINSLLFFYG